MTADADKPTVDYAEVVKDLRASIASGHAVKWHDRMLAAIQAIESLSQSNATKDARIAELEGKISQYRGRIAELVADLDNHYGTPCEQIRHQQALEKAEAALRECLAHADALSEKLESLTQQIHAFTEQHGEADFFTGAAIERLLLFREWRAKNELTTHRSRHQRT